IEGDHDTASISQRYDQGHWEHGLLDPSYIAPPSPNAGKDFGSRIRPNSGVWRESPKSGDFGYDVRAGFFPRQDA
ncbi:MAG: hypothetical protein NTY19_05340, partial [Planctomycetota bacterium]|nr:hypothetical protein [Planctomycetota bacterium]